MGGILGRLLNEFAVTIAVAIILSGAISLSLTPMLCSRFLKPVTRTRPASIATSGVGCLKRALAWISPRADLVDASPFDRLRRAALAHGGGDRVVFFRHAERLPAQPGYRPHRRYHRSGARRGLRASCSNSSSAPAKNHRAKIPAWQAFMSRVGGGGGSRTSNTGRFYVTLKPADQRARLGGRDRAGAPPRAYPGSRGSMSSPKTRPPSASAARRPRAFTSLPSSVPSSTGSTNRRRNSRPIFKKLLRHRRCDVRPRDQQPGSAG